MQSYRASLSASFINRYLDKVTYRRLGRKFHHIMKSGRLNKVINASF